MAGNTKYFLPILDYIVLLVFYSSKSVITAIAQINSLSGDFTGNRKKIISFAKQAKENNAALLLFPELSLCGYTPFDLPDQKCFTDRGEESLRLLQKEIPPGLACGFGYIKRGGNKTINAYGIVLDGVLVFEQDQTLRPVFEWKNKHAAVLCFPSASPYRTGIFPERLQCAEELSGQEDFPLLYCNAVGANDSIIYDGRSFVILPGGECVITAKAFKEDIVYWDTSEWDAVKNSGTGAEKSTAKKAVQSAAKKNAVKDDPYGVGLSAEELDILEDALVFGIRDYMAKCGFTKTHLGLSGGLDSALVAYLAVKAAGPDNVVCFSLPSRFSSQGSKDHAAELAANLGCRLETLSIEAAFTAFLSTLEKTFKEKSIDGRQTDVTEENIQPRIRGILLMAYSNKFNSMLLAAGNKSEIAMGYCTLYGDTAGALEPIGDLFKTEVFALCARVNDREKANGGKEIIPQAIIDKPPSAELRPDQKDEDSLPPYPVLDEILKLYLYENLSAEEIAARGKDRALAESVIRTVARSEFKRRQSPPVLRVSPPALGMGRIMPITRFIHES